MQIRPVLHADVPAVIDLLAELGYSQDCPSAAAERIGTWNEGRSAAAYVAVDTDDVLGVIAVHVCPFFERDGSWARIVALVVADRARGQGIGGSLVAVAESFATARGCLRMEVTSDDRRLDAHAFYRRCGYVDQSGTSSRFLRVLPGTDQA